LTASALSELSESLASLAERLGPSVVGLGRGWGRGSGVVIAPGQVLTSAHNLRSEEATVLRGGERAAARVAASDPDRDLALLEADTGDAPALEPLPAAEPAPGIGTPVVALADPGGRGLRATPGFVSAAGRRFRGPRGRRVDGGIEHTAPLPRGSSGGPLVDLDGRLLGVNSLRLEGGLILAVPFGTETRERLLDLASGQAGPPPRLGVAVAPARVARRMRRAVGLPERSGVLVRSVAEDSPAARAGLQPGDLIAGAAGRELDGVDGLYAALDALPGDGAALELTVVRGTEERQVRVSFDRSDG